MKTLLMTVAGLGLALSGAQACPYQKSVQSEQVDPTVVASVAVPQSEAATAQPTSAPEAATDAE